MSMTPRLAGRAVNSKSTSWEVCALDQQEKLTELSDLIDNLYKYSRLMRSAENKPLYYGGDVLMYPNEAYTLRAIAKRPGITQTELTDEMLRTKGATSMVVQELEKKGLVERRREDQDMRVVRLYPTEKGMKSYNAHLEYDIRYVDFLSSRINVSFEELAEVNKVLRQMISDRAVRVKYNIQFDKDMPWDEIQDGNRL